jgi:2-keto-4-pentenoate hydratase/2-oxohepta-3-ene-1,7-dioic acid hydratase in catechol pathway
MGVFKLATIQRQGKSGTTGGDIAALVVEDRLYPLDELAPDQAELQVGLFSLLQNWDSVYPTLVALAERVDGGPAGYAADDPTINLLTPVRYPRAVFCTVFNYYDFAAEAGVTPPDKRTTRPYVCVKLPHTVIGPNDTIVVPPHSRQADWEVELGAVIGRPCHQVFEKDALDYVAGYTIVNDISGRDIIARPDWPNFASDFFVSKNFDTATPIGPYLLPRAFLPDPQTVRLTLTRNGEIQQDGNTSAMIFTLAEQIAFISSIMTMLPGDIIATGTPAGVGWKRGLGLTAHDHIVLEIPEIGVMHNRVVGPLTMVPPASGTAFA